VLAAQRRELILETVRRTGAVRVSELTAILGVSDMTIRRDLDALDRAGLLEKVHGGATVTSSTHEPGFEAKSLREKQEKLAIARAAARLVEPGGAVGLSAGTTTWTLAHELRAVPQLTVVTNSTEVAEVLYHGPREDQTVLLTGGLRTPSGALVGPVAISALRDLNLDLVFMGVHGIDDEAGFTTPNLMEAETNRALIHAGRRLVVVADSTKWGVVGMSTYAALDEADVLVTDDKLPPDAAALLEERVGELVLASPDAAPLPVPGDEPDRESVGSAP
jgi:DeoR/GlpR family transcriptional regulator of sugar metabolism